MWETSLTTSTLHPSLRPHTHTPKSTPLFFAGSWQWEGPLVNQIKIPNNSNNNDNTELIKNGMFLTDCVSVVVFNYAIFIGILIIFSTNKPLLIKAKHG